MIGTSSVDKLHMLKKILKEATRIEQWQQEIYTALHNIDATWVTTGTFDAARIPGLDASKIVSGTFDVARIPDLDASKITSGRFPLSRLPTSSTANRFLVVRTANADPIYDALVAGDIPSITRSKISDFWNTPFWGNIPDKPSTFPPSAHASSHASGGADPVSLDASQIGSGVLALARIPSPLTGKELDFDEVLKAIQKHLGVFWFNNSWPPGMVYSEVSGSAYISWNALYSSYVSLVTGTTSLSEAKIWKLAYGLGGGVSWSKKRYFGVYVYFSTYTYQYIHIVSGNIYGAFSSGNTDAHIGFKLIDNDLYGTVANGTSESTLLLETLTGAVSRRLECVLTPGVECRFYVNGVDKGALTTNLPSGTTGWPQGALAASIYNTQAANKILSIYEARMFQVQ